jgi:hypothetical protein
LFLILLVSALETKFSADPQMTRELTRIFALFGPPGKTGEVGRCGDFWRYATHLEGLSSAEKTHLAK